MVVVHRALRTTVLPSRFRDSYLVCLAWLVAMAACPVVKLNGQDWKVRLDDGSIATGQLVSSANDDTVAIHIIGFQSPFNLDASAIVSLSHLESKPETATEQQQGMLHFELVDGNCFTGKLISVDAERLGIDSSVLGKLQVDRSSLQSISRNDNLGERLYDGPSTRDRWFSGKSTQLTDPIESTSLVALDGGSRETAQRVA